MSSNNQLRLVTIRKSLFYNFIHGFMHRPSGSHIRYMFVEYIDDVQKSTVVVVREVRSILSAVIYGN